MPQHGEIDKKKNMIYCGYWMTFDEWEEIHKYNPDLDIMNNNEDKYDDNNDDLLNK